MKLTIRNFKLLHKYLLFSLAISCSPLNLMAAPGDFDADGTSDLSVALVDKGLGTTAWLTRPSNGSAAKFWTFNTAADALVSMRFHSGDPKYYPGVVFVRSSKVPLEWTLKNAANQDVKFSWGMPGDIVPNQADIDCDGREDPLVVRNQNGILNWYFARTASNTIFHTVFGVAGDQVAVSDTKNDCTADMVVLRNNFMWYVRDPGSADFSTVQWGLNGDIPLLPTDLDKDNLTDYVISRRSTSVGGSQTAFIKYGNGQTEVIPLGFNTSIPQVGKFSETNNFAWSQRETGWTSIRNANDTKNTFQFGIAANAIIRADGTTILPTQDGRFPTVSSPVLTSSQANSNGLAALCSTTYSSGWLLKPRSQDTNDDRQGKPMILFSRNLPTSACLNVLSTNGTVIGKYGKFTNNRFYSGRSGRDRGCGSSVGPEELARRAIESAGSKSIFIQDPATNVCWGSGPADGRTDRR